jgi:ABC-type nitrate/sulfonate/bicarbonate transport system permease component
MGRGFMKSLLPLVVVGIIWEITASRIVNPLFPPVSVVLSSMWRLILNGTLEQHVISTMWRLLFGFGAAVAFGIPLGLLMARSKKVETAALPIVSVLMPIPAIAWVPLFILWFGLGERPTIYLVAFETFLPMVFNSWTGTKTINEVWVRAAQSMGARGGTLFLRVVVPAALPFIITGMRIGLARAWRAVVAG